MQANLRKGIPPRHLDCPRVTDVDVGKGTSQVELVGVYVIFATEEEPGGPVPSVLCYFGSEYLLRDTFRDGCVCIFIVNLCC